MVFAFRHRLSNVGIGHLVEMLHFLLPQKVVPSSFYALRKSLSFIDDVDYDVFYYCNHCNSPLKSKSHICDSEGCLGRVKMNVGLYAVYKIQEIMQKLMSRKSFMELRTYKNTRVSNEDGTLCDIMDGDKWKVNKEIYDNPSNIVMGLSTDGVPLYKSSRRSMWPIWGVYYDLPPESRYKRHNMTLLGVSYGSKPIMNRFLLPIVKVINKTFIDPMRLMVGDEEISYKVIVFNCVADLPAKASLLNMHQYNGEYGCPYCFHPGTNTGRGSARYYGDTLYPDRTHDIIMQDGNEASRIALVFTVFTALLSSVD
eukprot:Pompholyxophrys_sp_v1_NODE_125_length_1742_cov_3.723770.p1 type:complete len:312 gc:universal NODE_125_length_1742_cov_3.723770:1472-537(-)